MQKCEDNVTSQTANLARQLKIQLKWQILTVQTLSVSLDSSSRSKRLARQSEYIKAWWCGYSTCQWKKPLEPPSKLVPIHLVRAPHFKNRNWRHTPKSSIICWQRMQLLTSWLGPICKLWVSSSPMDQVQSNSLRPCGQRSYSSRSSTKSTVSRDHSLER